MEREVNVIEILHTKSSATTKVEQAIVLRCGVVCCGVVWRCVALRCVALRCVAWGAVARRARVLFLTVSQCVRRAAGFGERHQGQVPQLLCKVLWAEAAPSLPHVRFVARSSCAVSRRRCGVLRG